MYLYCHAHVCNGEQMQPGPLPEGCIATILKEVIKGLDYLHAESKIHRDVKGT